MLIAGIVGQGAKNQITNLIYSIFTSIGKKVSAIDTRSLKEFDSAQIRTYIGELRRNSTDVLILKINLPDIQKEIFNFIHFDIMVYAEKADDLVGIDKNSYWNLMRRACGLLDENGLAIVNVDDSDLISYIQGMKCYFVTYGFNSKASITTSSVGDGVFKDSIMCCLQRSIHTRQGVVIEPQEYSIKVDSGEIDDNNVLAAASFAIVSGVNLNSAIPGNPSFK